MTPPRGGSGYFHRTPRKTFGILGGSFNPAHVGHVHVSREAMKRLGLDGVIWLVSPANPLKEKSSLADYTTRCAKAQTIAAADPRIIVSDFEQRMGLRYSIDTVRALSHCHPALVAGSPSKLHQTPQQVRRDTQYIFLIGSDNLACFHQWRGWQDIFATIPIAVLDRAPHSHAALRSVAAQRFCAARIPERHAQALKCAKTPAWCYLHMPRNPQSATNVRKTLGADAFIMA